MAKIFDNPDEWFKGDSNKTTKTKGSAGGLTLPKFRKPSTGASQAPNHIKNGANSISGGKTGGGKKLPQVMVKISGSSKGCDKAQAHVNYIGRKGEVEVEDEEGIKYKGDEQKELLKGWEAMGLPSKDKESGRKEAYHIVFSMPKGTSPEGMKEAVKNLVQEEFDGHKYFIAQHLDTDNPHCHVLLTASDDRGARLNPRKKDLHNYRVRFVEKLAEQGIEATAARRVHRFEHKDSKRQGVVHRDKRQGRPPKPNPTPKQQAKIDETHSNVLDQYKDYAKTTPVDAEDKKALEKMIKKQGQKLDKGMDRG